MQSLSSIQSLSHVWLFATPQTAARQASLSITNSRSWLKLMSIESAMPSSHLILCHPLLLLPPIPPSIRVFSNESTLRMRWPEYWSFSFSISPSNEHLWLISFRMDWLDLPAVEGTLKSLLQHPLRFYQNRRGTLRSLHSNSAKWRSAGHRSHHLPPRLHKPPSLPQNISGSSLSHVLYKLNATLSGNVVTTLVLNVKGERVK